MNARFALTLVILLLLALFWRLPAVAQQDAPAAVCQVSANYIETVDENQATLLKLLSMVNAPRSPLDAPDVAGLYYTMLVSTRHYHEDLRSTLPPCAHELNRLLIRTLAASQDVVGMRLAQSANPEHSRYEQRVAQTVAHLNETWPRLVRVSETTSLAAEE